MRAYWWHTKIRWGLAVSLVSAFLALVLMQSDGAAKSDKAKHPSHMAAYQLYQNKCLECHASIADPEKPGRTRDEWHIVVNVMHGHGIDMTDAEGDILVDWLYALRKGIEKDPG
jgi:hypothetical protein